MTPDICYEICGDGLNMGHVQCDTGPYHAYDGCNSKCEVEEGWYCYGGSPTGPDTCYEICGDGRLFHNRTAGNCDDGNLINYDGCSSTCHVEKGYQCAGGNYDHESICTEVCGDGMKLTNEKQCDDGNLINGDGCSSTCVIEFGFKCKPNPPVTHIPDVCYEICGDGLRFHSPAIKTFCDDGNNINYDGCDSVCAVEDGYYCYGGTPTTRDVCYEICGDGKHMGLLECDDGNTVSGDGCSQYAS